MIHRIYSATFLALFTLAIAGCGGGGSSGPPTKLSEAFLEAIHRHCEKAFDCKSSYVSSMHGNKSFEDYVAGSTVDTCFNSVKTLLLTPPPACDTVEVGQVPTAGACTLNEDCAIAGDSCDATRNTCG